MAFQKGQSGNPGGRPKMPKELSTKLKEMAPAAFNRVCELMKSTDERVALAASKEIMDREWGRPKEHVMVESKQPAPELTDDALTRIASGGGDRTAAAPVNPPIVH